MLGEARRRSAYIDLCEMGNRRLPHLPRLLPNLLPPTEKLWLPYFLVVIGAVVIWDKIERRQTEALPVQNGQQTHVDQATIHSFVPQMPDPTSPSPDTAQIRCRTCIGL